MRTLDENYYESALLSYLMKIGTISQPSVIHNKPEFYGLTDKEAINCRLRHLRANLRQILKEFNAIKAEYLRGEREFGYIALNSLQLQIDKLQTNIKFNYARLRGEVVNQPFDLAALKKIPMNQITRINNNNFFQVNPFRTEKEPSNSLFWYKKDNRATDFATGKNYDNIDVYQAVNNCDFKTACKELSSIT